MQLYSENNDGMGESKISRQKLINNQIMSHKHKYLIVGDNDQHRMHFVNQLNLQSRSSDTLAQQNPIYRTVNFSTKIQSIGDYPIKCLHEIREEVNSISGIIVLVNKEDMEKLTSLICQNLSANLKQIIDIYCCKIDLQNDNTLAQPKLILATTQEFDYKSNNDIFTNIESYLREQVREYLNKFNYRKIYKHLIIDKLGQWKVLSRDVTKNNTQLIRRQLQNCDFDSTQSQIFGNNQYLNSCIPEPALSMSKQSLQGVLNRSDIITETETEHILKQQVRLVHKKPCLICQLI